MTPVNPRPHSRTLRPLRALRSKRWHRHAGGYILLFTLGVLAVISVLVLGMAISTRLDTQLLAREKSRLQDEYALQAAANHLAGRLSVAALALKSANAKPLDDQERAKLWLPDAGSFELRFAERDITIELTDAGLLPDANLLSETEWQRLFAELGADADAAARMAKSMIRVRQDLGQVSGSPGLASLVEVVDSAHVPRSLSSARPSEERLGIEDLLLVGTQLKQLDINRSPLALFKALGGVSDEKISQLKLWRSSGVIAVPEAQKWVQGTPIKLMLGKSGLVRAKLSFQTSGGESSGLHAIALLSVRGDVYQLINFSFFDAY